MRPQAHGFVSAPRLFEELERQRQREQLLMGKQPPAFVLAQRAAKQPRRIFFPALTLQVGKCSLFYVRGCAVEW